MAEAKRRTSSHPGLDFSIDRPVRFVRREEHHDVGRLDCVLDQGRLKSGRCCVDQACRSAPQPHHDVGPAVVQVQCLRAALVAIA